MPVRDGKKRTEISAEVYTMAQTQAGLLGVAASWLIDGLVRDALTAEPGPATRLLRVKREEAEARKHADHLRFEKERAKAASVRPAQAPRGRR